MVDNLEVIMDALGRTYEDVSDGSTVPVYRAASATPCHNEGKEYEDSAEIEYLKVILESLNNN